MSFFLILSKLASISSKASYASIPAYSKGATPSWFSTACIGSRICIENNKLFLFSLRCLLHLPFDLLAQISDVWLQFLPYLLFDLPILRHGQFPSITQGMEVTGLMRHIRPQLHQRLDFRFLCIADRSKHS